VSVIVAARNEEKNLPALIACLQAQDYPQEKLEIIIVDDRSDDNTWTILTEAERQHDNIKALRITERLADYAPKKRALDMGIRASKGAILLLTDADCLPSPAWAHTVAGYYSPDVHVVAGYSPYVYSMATSRLVRGMLSLDCFAFAAVAAASTGWGQPLTPTGTNLSYRRDVYFSSGGFEPIKQWISGDDDLFMRYVAGKNLGRFSYALDPAAYVPTFAPISWRQFWHQRIRFGSKSKHHNLPIILGAVAVFLLNAGISLGVVLAMSVGTPAWTPVLIVWGPKALAEFIFLASIASRFNESALLTFFLPTAILHPFYITVFGFLGLFAKFRWKD